MTGVYVADPDGPDARAHALDYHQSDNGGTARIHVTVPRLEFWSLIVVKVADSQSHH